MEPITRVQMLQLGLRLKRREDTPEREKKEEKPFEEYLQEAMKKDTH